MKGYLINILQVSIGIDNFLLVLEKLVSLIQLESLSRCLMVLKTQFHQEETPVSDHETSKKNEELMRSHEMIERLEQEKEEMLLCIGLQQMKIKALSSKLDELGISPNEVVASSLGGLVMDRKVH